MKKMYLFTLSYPYGMGEKTFISPELNEISMEYEVTILTCASKEQIQNKACITEVNDSVSVIHLKDYLNRKEKIIYFFQTICSSLFWKEIWLLKKCKRNIRQCFYFTLSFFARAINIRDQVENLKLLDQEAVFYTYWYNYCTLGLLMAKKKRKGLSVITRTHGYDLYNERCPGDWQPFKHYMTKSISAVYFICKAGRDYYIDTYVEKHELEAKLYLARMGVKAKGKRNEIEKGATFELVSCSNMIPLKRIELIIDALSLCSDQKIHWTHFGDGESRKKIENLAKEKLNTVCTSYSFLGHVKNEEVMDFYENHSVHCFITTSATEGCPVSVQEALAYGIPVIGTAVGGIPECIRDNGVLLPENPSAAEVADAINRIYDASEEGIANMRENSYQLWQERFDSERNYKAFVKNLKESI